MGGKQAMPKSTQGYIPLEAQQYKRFCLVCRRTTFDWECCGKRTRRLKLEVTIGENIDEKVKKLLGCMEENKKP